MPRIATHDLLPGEGSLEIYNGLDCAITLEVHEALTAITGHNDSQLIYKFERALQAPALEMMLRGWKIDEYERKKGQVLLRSQFERLNNILQRYAFAIWEKGLNPNSPKQLIDFFYGAMRLPEQWISQKGVKRISTNREALEKLQVYFYALPIINVILDMREIGKKLSVLETEITRSGRFNTSYNIAGTNSGRWSSSEASDGTGSNLQNITPELRKMFVSDPGYKLLGIDLEQTEARDVGWLQGVILNDWTFLDACEGGDLHTNTAKRIWGRLNWTGEPKADRKIADGIFYRQFSYRDMAKRGAHLSNYMGTAWTAARSLKVPIQLMDSFQASYLKAYPAFPRWWRWVAQQLQTKRYLETPLGRGRHFFGRPNDDATLRQAIAFVPQSTTADRLNLGLWRVWKNMGNEVELLGQVHDAIYLQYKETANEKAIVEACLKYMEVEQTHPSGRKMIVPGEAKIGWNWASMSPSNPDGLKKWNKNQPDTRKKLLGLERGW